MNASISSTPAGRGRLHHRLDLGDVEAERLLAQDVLARGGRPQGPLGVQVLGSGM